MKVLQFPGSISLISTLLKLLVVTGPLASAYHFNTPAGSRSRYDREGDHSGGGGGGKEAACQALCGQFIGKGGGGGGPVPYSGETAVARTGGKEYDGCWPKGERCYEQWQCCNGCSAIYNLGNCY